MKLFETSKPSSVFTAGTTLTLYTYPVPPNCKLTLRKLGNYTDAAGWGYVTWKLLKNGIPVYPYENIKDQRGIGNTPADTEPVVYDGGDVLAIQAVNSHGSSGFLVGVSLGFDVG